jgi:WD40 repeat protein
MASGRADTESANAEARPIRILLLAASPKALEQTRVTREVRLIQEKLRASAHRSGVELIPRLAARVDDLLQALLEVEPDVVHFSGHGTEENEIILEEDDGWERPVRKQALADLFGVLKDRIRVVVLNACYSQAQAEAIAEHVDCTIGMNDAMPDDAAIEFAAAFYQAVGFGRSVQTAFDLGVKALALKGIDGATVPELILKRGVDAKAIVLVRGASSPASTPAVAPPPALGRLVNVPELPPNFLPRESDLERLKALVLGSSIKAVGLTGRTLRAGVHGMGGIGKSVLAAGLARDEDVRRTFPDGVLWITLGREPKLTLLQSELCGYLGERGAAFEHEHRGRARLTELSRGRACLVILDDVWDARHAAAFGELGPEGRVLLTTRDAGLVISLGAEACSLDVLGVHEALALLAGWSGQPIEALPHEAREIAKECGYLPLALGMIGAMVRGRAGRWGNALHKLRTADLEAIRRSFPDYAYPDLLRAIEVSLEALEPDQRKRYLDFAVFAEDTPVPEAVLATLWKPEGLDAYATQDLLDGFVDRSLLRRDEDGRLRLHDLQYDYVRTRAGDLARLHGRLVDAYRAACPTGWASGPNDGYFFLHLATHLAAAGRSDELRALLLDYTWLEAKLTRTDPAALLADFQLPPASEVERLIEGALRLSAHVLAIDREQLAPQLLGRLLDVEHPDVQELVRAAWRLAPRPRLCPMTTSLTRPGGPLRCTLAGHSSGVLAVTVTPDGRNAVSGSFDKTLKVWELATGREVRTLAGHLGGVTSVAVTPDGLYAVSGSFDKTLKVWELATGREVRTLVGGTGMVRAVAVTPDGRSVIAGCTRGRLTVWDLATGRQGDTRIHHRSGIKALAVTPDGRFAVSSCDNEWTLSVSELATGREVCVLAMHSNEVGAVAVTPDGSHVISGSDDKTLKVCALTTSNAARASSEHSNEVGAVAMTPDGSHVVSGSDDGTLKVWGLFTRRMRVLAEHAGSIRAVAVTPNGRFVISGSLGMRLTVRELSTGREIRARDGASDEGSSAFSAVALMPDSLRAVVSTGKQLNVCDLSTGRVTALGRHSSLIRAVAVTPDGQHAIAGSDDGALVMWDLSTGREACVLSGHSGKVFAVAVAPNGLHAVSGSEDATLKVWELSTGLAARTLAGHAGAARAVAVMPCGRYVASASDDRTLRIWDLGTGALCATFHGDNPFRSLAVATGYTVVTGDTNGRLHFLRLEGLP